MIGHSKMSNITNRTLAAILAFAMVFTATFGMGYKAEDSYAKAIGNKNEQACDGCKMVVKGDAPKMKDYSSYVAGKNPETERAS